MGSFASAPNICVSSPRITSGNSPVAITPGTIDTVVPRDVVTVTSPATSASAPAGTSTYGASRQPCALPTIPAASTGTPGARSSQSPHASSNTTSKARAPPAGTCITPAARLRVSSSAPCASNRYARSDVVPQSSAISDGAAQEASGAVRVELVIV